MNFRNLEQSINKRKKFDGKEKIRFDVNNFRGTESSEIIEEICESLCTRLRTLNSQFENIFNENFKHFYEKHEKLADSYCSNYTYKSSFSLSL